MKWWLIDPVEQDSVDALQKSKLLLGLYNTPVLLAIL